MMENINDLLKNFRERISSPFFFSFIISWIIVNWKVTIALLWYNSELYPEEGDLINFIETNTSNWKSVCLPLIGAIVYTGVIRNAVSAFVAFGSKWGGNLNLFISKESKIPMSKFLTYRNLYIQSNKDLEKVIEDERKTIEQFDKQHQQTLKLETDNVMLTAELSRIKADWDAAEFKRVALDETVNKLQSEVDKQAAQIEQNQNFVKKYRDHRFLDGTWHFRFDNAMRNIRFEETYYVNDGVFFTKNQTHTESIFKIVYYFHDSINRRLLLMLKFIAGTEEANFIQRINVPTAMYQAHTDREVLAYHRARYEPVIIQELQVESSRILKGTENVEALISYSWVS